IQLVIGTHIRLLQHVFRLGVLADHGARDPEQALVAALHDVAERLALAAANKRHQRVVVQRGVVDGCNMGMALHDFLLLHPIRCICMLEGSRLNPREWPGFPSGAAPGQIRRAGGGSAWTRRAGSLRVTTGTRGWPARSPPRRAAATPGPGCRRSPWSAAPGSAGVDRRPRPGAPAWKCRPR